MNEVVRLEEENRRLRVVVAELKSEIKSMNECFRVTELQRDLYRDKLDRAGLLHG